MNAVSKIEAASGLALLRAPFPAHHISKLPKPTKAQTDAVRQDFKKGIRCQQCGAWHHPDVVHLDYVGHAALTDRLLDADPAWSWEPVADPQSVGLPTVPGGMWIKLTVEGVSRYGFGCADGKSGGDAIKEVIGDALRNAAMRFGAALDLWHKGDLHADEEQEAPAPRHDPQTPALITEDQRGQLMALAVAVGVDAPTLCAKCKVTALPQLPADKFASVKAWLESKRAREVKAIEREMAEIIDDEIPY